MPEHNRAGVRLATSVLLALSVLASVVGCGSFGHPERTPSTAAGTVSPTDPATGGSDTNEDSTGGGGDDGSSGSSTTAAPKKRNVIEWILSLGVDAPSGPTGHKEDMFRVLTQRRCDLVDNDFPVFSAAAAACLAASATGDIDTLWDQATQVRDSTDRRTLDCMDAAAYQLLDALVEAHQEHPELPFRFTTGDGGPSSTCLEVSSVHPTQGTSGDLVTIRGTHLDRATAVRLADPTSAVDVAATIVKQSRTRLQVRLPADIQGRGQNLQVLWQQPTGQSTAWVPFAYGPESDSGPDETTSNEADTDTDQPDPGSEPSSP